MLLHLRRICRRCGEFVVLGCVSSIVGSLDCDVPVTAKNDVKSGVLNCLIFALARALRDVDLRMWLAWKCGSSRVVPYRFGFLLVFRVISDLVDPRRGKNCWRCFVRIVF